MKKISLFFLIFFTSQLFSQVEWKYSQLTNSAKIICSVNFPNADVGYAITRELGWGTTVYKSINKGVNWNYLNYFENIKSYDAYPTVKFLDENTGFIVVKGENQQYTDNIYIYKTVNGGNNWTSILSSPVTVDHENGGGGTNITTFLNFVEGNNNIGYLNTRYELYKTTDFCQTWSKIISYDQNYYGYKILSLEISKTNSNCIYACGGTNYRTNISHPEIRVSSNGGNSWTSYSSNSPELGAVWYASLLNNNGSELIKFAGNAGTNWESAIMQFDVNNGFSLIINLPSEYWGHQFDMLNVNDGILMVDYYDENMVLNYKIESTSNGGLSWDNDDYFLGPDNKIDIPFVAKCGEIRYLFGKNNVQNNCFVLKSEINVNLLAKNNYTDENTSSANMQLNDHYYNSFNGSVPHNMNILGGSQTVSISSSSPNEVFYKWNSYSVNGDFHPLNAGIDNYYIDKGDVIANFKSKFKSTVPTAISNSPQTKAIKDTILTSLPNGIIHEIHESMGGIFYSRSTDGGSNFSKEEVVNYNPYTNDADGNKNSYLNVLREYGTYNPITQTDQNNNAVATWERYNSNTQSTEIFVSRRYYESPTGSVDWRRYYNSQNNPVFKSFTAPQDFNSYPKVFAIIKYATYEDINQSIIYVPHLEPYGTNQKKLVVSASVYNNGFVRQDFELDNGNISDVSVTGIKTIFGGYTLYFAYIKDNSVIYRKEVFIYENGMSFSRASNPEVTDISYNDGQLSRITPDISLRNGRPIVTYRATSVIQKLVQFQNEEDLLLNYFNYPIFVKYKYPTSNNGEAWSTPAIYHSAGIEQKNPNIEGCKNGNAFVLNFNYNNQYRQVAYLQNGPGYCNPGQYSVTDAKLVRGSFYGASYPYSSPILLTLNQSGTLYNLSKEIFSISNIPVANSNVDNNLLGIIREQNLNYNFNLGPIIAKNTNVSFASELETSIDNLVTFSNTMVSAPFSLGPNDTLILNGKGFYNFVSGETFSQKRFSVFLMRKSTQEPYQTLFTDSIGVLDTIESEYLRGFVFDGDLMPQVDSFYVQLIIDSTSLYQGDEDYSICNVYSPDEVYGDDDNSHSYKRAVHFMNRGNSGNNISNIPKVYSLSQNYPNPFNPVTNIKYQIPKDGLVTIKVYDITGREIAKLVNEVKQAGNYTVSFNGSNFASGVYFYRIQSGDFTQVKKMLMIK